MTRYRETFEIGSLLLINGKITTLLVNHITKGPQRGLSKARRSLNGNHPDRVLFYGYMASVSHRPVLFRKDLIILTFRSGFRKERALVRLSLAIDDALKTYGTGQFHDHRGDRGDAQIWARVTRIPLL